MGRIFADTNVLFPLALGEDGVHDVLWTDALLINEMPGTDPDDHEHMAAAVAGQSCTILTHNMSDFPSEPSPTGASA